MVEYLKAMWTLAVAGEVQGVSFFAALYALVMLGYSTWYQLQIASWPKTCGVLLNSAVEKAGGTELVSSNQEYLAKALYEYSVDESVYRGRRVSPWVIVATHNVRFVLQKQLDGIRRGVDGRVAVFYNPKNPAKCFLVKPARVGIVVTFLLALAPMSAYLLAYHASP